LVARTIALAVEIIGVSSASTAVPAASANNVAKPRILKLFLTACISTFLIPLCHDTPQAP
jgi:hypothetical protein